MAKYLLPFRESIEMVDQIGSMLAHLIPYHLNLLSVVVTAEGYVAELDGDLPEDQLEHLAVTLVTEA